MQTNTSKPSVVVDPETDKPVIDRSPIIAKSASESGSSARLTCRARGTPNATFVWKREGSVIENEAVMVTTTTKLKKKSSKSASKSAGGSSAENNADKPLPKYVVEETRQLDLITYQSVLIVNDVDQSDYGSYDCVARNELGFDVLTIPLNHTSKPDAPKSVHVVNVTSGSVTLRWVAGFDGGLGQSFRIRYKTADYLVDQEGAAYAYRDVFPGNATTATVNQLRDNTEYWFSVMATNDKGDSEYSADVVKVSTLKGTMPLWVPNFV